MEDELLNKIRKDLEKSGLDSELKASRIFEENGWRLFSASYYFDKDDRKTREIDIRANITKNLTTKDSDDALILNDISIDAEVKKSEKPWIIFKDLNSYPHILHWSEKRDIKLHNVDEMDLENSLIKYKEIFISRTVGSNIHEAFKHPNDSSRWYNACLSAIKSSIDSYEESMENVSEQFYERYRVFSIYYPLIILDGKLISAHLNDKNNIELEYLENATLELEFGTKEYEQKTHRVEIVTLEGLDKYLKLLKVRQNCINTEIIKLDGLNSENEYLEID